MVGLLLAGPFWGMVADKWHCHKSIIVITFIGLIATLGSQPLLSIKYGDSTVNICPLSKKESSANKDKYDRNCSLCANNDIIENCSFSENITGLILRHSKITRMLSENETTHHYTGQPEKERLDKKKYGTLFFVMFFIQIATLFFESSNTIFIDTATLRRSQLSENRKIEYGKQRFWGGFGGMAGITLTNLVIEYFPRANITCYTGLYITYVFFTFLVTVFMLLLYKGLSFKTEDQDHDNKVTTAKNKETFKKIFLKALLQFDIMFLYLTTLICGVNYSTYVSFFYLHLKDLNAPPTVFSLSIVIASAGSMFGFFFSNKIIKLIGGTWKTIVITFLAIAVRNAALAFIVNPWLILLPQIIHPFTFTLYLAVGLKHLKEVSPLPVLTTMVSLFISTFMGLGAIVGSSLSGVVFNSYGGHTTFLSACVLSFSWTLVVIAFTVNVMKNKHHSKQ